MGIFGIDLGTTFCAVAFVQRGQPRAVPLDGTLPTLRSEVLLSSRGGPSCVVGRAARKAYFDLLGNAPEAPDDAVLIRGSKNHLCAERPTLGGPPWHFDGREVSSADTAGVILRALAELTRRQPGLPPLESVVVTHPQRFRNREKLATAQAVKMAGLRLEGMVTEPDAAAWAYGLAELGTAPRTFMVFDFGGGTLDVTLMHAEPNERGPTRIRALGSYGIQCGGLRIDARLRDALVEKYARGSRDPSVTLADLAEASREELLGVAEALKIRLNQDASTDPGVQHRRASRGFTPVFADGTEGPRAVLDLSYDEFTRCIEGDLASAIGAADVALERADMRWSDLDTVLLTGGSSQIWALQQRMQERCGGRARVVYDDADHPLNPTTLVASGAALYGESLRTAGVHAAVELRGVVPDTFSVRAFVRDASSPEGRRAVLDPLVPAGTPTPHRGTVRTFSVRGGGKSLPVEVWEGHSLHEATRVGVYRLEFDREFAAGERVEVQLDVQANGVLVLGVRDTRTGDMRSARLDDAPGLLGDRELEEHAAWVQALPLECGG